jgi:hypothetical protein
MLSRKLKHYSNNMATLSDIIAKREELAKTNPNATNVEARQALMGAPAVPATPTPAPTPIPSTVNVREQMSGMNVAERQAVRNGTVLPTPAPMVQAPVDTTTGLSKPLEATPTPVTQPVAETPKVDATPGINATTYAQANAESEKIKAQNEAVMAQNKQKSELATQDRQAIAKETQIANTPTDQKGIVTSMLSGVNVPVQKTREYNNAVVISDQFKKYNGMTPVQLLDNLKQGQIGTELDSLLSQNPNYAKAKAELAKAQKTASINRATQIASNVISGKETPVIDDLANIEAKYSAPIGANEQAYLSYVTRNPDVVSAGTQVKQLSNQISTLTTSYNDALKSLKSQYGDMPASALLILMGSRTNDTKELLDSYINAKELANGDFDLAMKMAEGHYNSTSKDIAEQQQIAQEERQMQNQLNLGQAQFDQKLAQQTQMMNDPATAIQSVMSEFAGMGITSQQSLQTKIADAQKFVANGGTLAGYVDKMRQDYMAKPQYKAMQDAEMNKYAPKATEYGFSNIGDGRIAITNPKTGTVSFANAGSVSSTNAPTTASAKYLDIPNGTDV